MTLYERKEDEQQDVQTVWTIVLAMLLYVGVNANVLINRYSFTLRQVLGDGEMKVVKAEGSENWDANYYKADAASDADALQAAVP